MLCAFTAQFANSRKVLARVLPHGHLADAHVLPLRVPPPSVVHLCAAVGWVGAQNFFQAVGVARCVKEGRPHPDESDRHAVTKRLWGSTFGADLGCCSVLIGRMAGA